ncbi:MAG: hypothetical protein ACRC5T_06270 [Cetobacterium sp.]
MIKKSDISKVEFLRSKKHFLKKGDIYINENETGYIVGLIDGLYQLSEVIATTGNGKISLPVMYNDNFEEFINKLETFFKHD